MVQTERKSIRYGGGGDIIITSWDNNHDFESYAESLNFAKKLSASDPETEVLWNSNEHK